jgi:hypothetical protein
VIAALISEATPPLAPGFQLAPEFQKTGVSIPRELCAPEEHHTMRCTISVVVLFVCFAIERPVTQTRESPVDIVQVSTGVARDSGHPVTLVTREGEGSLREAFVVVHAAGSHQAISFTGPARVLGGRGSLLAVLPMTGRGWVFLPQKATFSVKGVTTRPADVRITSITKVPVGTARSHQQLEATLMSAR